jgi:putative inorganic carbon (HCO3(-)) transporter
MTEPLTSVSAAKWLTFASSVIIVLGIAPSQILLGLSLAVLLTSRLRPSLPPIRLQAGLFVLGTLLAVALSGDPMACFPQVKKMFVFCQLLVAYTFLKETKMARWMVLSWAACGTASALLGLYQLGVKIHRIRVMHQDPYAGYLSARITGFMSHWYTFSVLEMISLLMLGSFVLFSPSARKHLWVWGSCALVMGLGVIFAETRAVWIATAIGGVYLLWGWRRWSVLLVPIVALGALLVTPNTIRQRAVSIVRPGSDDSNGFRTILFRTGIQMVKAHPWFGLGPEMPGKKFMDYVPSDVPRPLPSGYTGHLHNLYLEYAAERGIPVLLIFLWLIGKILWDFGRGLRAAPVGRDDNRFILQGGIAVLLALLVEGTADVNLGDSEVLTMFLVIVAIGYNAVAHVQRASSIPQGRQFPTFENSPLQPN